MTDSFDRIMRGLRRAPEGPARILLAMLERNPRIVEETLS